MWISARHLDLLEGQLQELKLTLARKESEHKREVESLRRSNNELVERLMLKNNVPFLPEKGNEKVEAFDIFADVEADPYENTLKGVRSEKLDEFAR